MKVCVLFRCSKKTGKIDMTMTSLGSAQLKLWALQNTPKTKMCFVFDRETGEVIYQTIGSSNGFPDVKDCRHEEIGTCEDFGIPLEMLHEIKDDRFDKEEENV